MKRILGLIIALLAGLTAIRAMSYEEARDRARFLTDKMAYELNLNEQQYNDAYEINLDYLMNIRTESDLSGVYLEHRNADFRYILYDWQYALFQAATYFFRPVLWRATGWFLPVYTIYTPTLFYYDPPRVFRIYRGGHYAYRHEHRVSFYAHRRPAWHGGLRGESRGPVPGRMTTPHRKPASAGSPGFRFEPVGRPGRPAQPNRRPANDKGPGFRFEPVEKPGNTTSRPTRPGNTTTPAARPQETRPQPRRTGNAQPATNKRTQSNYTRPSSTRATVRQTQPRSTRPTSRPQPRVTNRQSVRKPSATRAPARRTSAPAQRHNSERR